MRCLPQEFLRDGGTLAQLQNLHHIHVKRHPQMPNLVMLKYDMIESAMGDPLVQQCRGLILDEADSWAVVARPFDKFFNHGEGHAAPIDWGTARAQEKLDGSLMILYCYKGQWQVASSGTPDAGGEVNGCGFTFRDLFWKTWDEAGVPRPDPREESWLDPDFTYMLELMTPYNRVVVRHRTNKLALIGVRNIATGREIPVSEMVLDHVELPYCPFPVVREFDLNTQEGLDATFREMNPLEQEGYVVVDANFHRIKVKHPGYVAIHHMRDGFGPRRILEVIRTGETPELLTHFPEWKPAFDTVQAAYLELVQHLEAAFERIKGIPVQKDFALEAIKTRYSATLFQLRKGQVKSVQQSLAEMSIRNLVELLGIKDVEL